MFKSTVFCTSKAPLRPCLLLKRFHQAKSSYSRETFLSITQRLTERLKKPIAGYGTEISSDKSKIIVNSIKPRSSADMLWMNAKALRAWTSSNTWDPHKPKDITGVVIATLVVYSFVRSHIVFVLFHKRILSYFQLSIFSNLFTT